MINLKQRVFLKGFRQVTIRDEESIKIITSENGATKEFAVPLSIIDDNTNRAKNLSSSYLTALIIFMVLTISMIVIFLITDNEEDKFFSGVFAFVLCGPNIYIAFRLWITSYDYDIFYNRLNGEPIFSLFRNKPSKQIYEKFKKTFDKGLKEIQQKDKQSKDKEKRRALNYRDYLEVIKNLEMVGILSGVKTKEILQKIRDKLGQDRVLH